METVITSWKQELEWCNQLHWSTHTIWLNPSIWWKTKSHNSCHSFTIHESEITAPVSDLCLRRLSPSQNFFRNSACHFCNGCTGNEKTQIILEHTWVIAAYIPVACTCNFSPLICTLKLESEIKMKTTTSSRWISTQWNACMLVGTNELFAWVMSTSRQRDIMWWEWWIIISWYNVWLPNLCD